MFGYVKPYTPELRIIEDKYYKAAYCGLCRTMKTETGFLSSFLLSYDVTFLVLSRLALTGEKPEFENSRCIAHPFEKRLVMLTGEALRFSANVCALLTYHKFEDDVADEKGMKRLKAKFLKAVFSSAYKKAKESLTGLDEMIKNDLDGLRTLEREKTRSVDRPAALFGGLMEKIFTFGIENETEKKIASAIGFNTGRWIYITDALDDIKDDAEKHSYNPFVLLYDGNELDQGKKKDVESASASVISKVSAAFDLVDFDGRRDLCGLITNILTEGMPRVTHEILFPYSDAENNTSNGENQ